MIVMIIEGTPKNNNKVFEKNTLWNLPMKRRGFKSPDFITQKTADVVLF